MKISIIIPVYNSSLTLKECMDAVFNSNFKNFEVIVISDNSSDNSVRIAEKYKCKILELPENKGPSFARNEGVKEATGDILLFLDSDVVIKKDALNHINENFLDNAVDAIQGIYSHKPTYKNMATQYQQSYTLYYIWPESKKYASTLSTCCFAIRKKIFSEFKGFDTNIKRATCEDEIFGYELINKGYKILILRDLNVEHRVHYTIKHFIKRTFNRYTSHMKFYLRSKAYIDKIKQTNYLKVLAGIPILGLIMLSIFLTLFFANKVILLIFLILNIIFLLLHRDFIRFVGRTKGIHKALGITAICYLDTFMMLTGMFFGILSYYLGKKY